MTYPGPYTPEQVTALLALVEAKIPGLLDWCELLLKNKNLWPADDE